MTYYIIGDSRFGSEIIDESTSEHEAGKLVAEYALAFGGGWAIRVSLRPSARLLQEWEQ